MRVAVVLGGARVPVQAVSGDAVAGVPSVGSGAVAAAGGGAGLGRDLEGTRMGNDRAQMITE